MYNFRIISFIIILYSKIGICQEIPVNMLELTKEKDFKEVTCGVGKDKNWTLILRIFYNVKEVDDEEQWYTLSLVIADTLEFKRSKFLDLEKDTSAVKAFYSVRSIWGGSSDKFIIKGQIKLLENNPNSISLYLNIRIISTSGNITYKGKRVFLVY